MAKIYRPQSPLSWCLLSVTGKDSSDFLHRLTTVDVSRLNPGQGESGFWLTPQGKTRAFFTLWKFGESDFRLEFDASLEQVFKKSLLAAIEDATFAEKLSITDLSDTHTSVWVFPDSPTAVPPDLRDLTDYRLRINPTAQIFRQSDTVFDRPWFSVWTSNAEIETWLEMNFPMAEPTDLKELDAWRVPALSPWSGAEIDFDASPLEAGLSRLFTKAKGCYPGQEVIEKIISLGAPAKQLALLEWADSASPPFKTKLTNLDGAEVGDVRTTAIVDTRPMSLAYLKKIYAKPGLEVQTPEGKRARVIRVSQPAR